MASEDKSQTPEDFDLIVSAEIPDKEEQPKLYKTVSRNMIHGPCGIHNPSSPCMVDGKCSKYYPREFTTETSTNKSGYPIYRRRQNSRTIKKHGVSIDIDNRWIVPYNPYLSQKYNCHLNVEICSSIKSIKYLYKYVYKGQDRVLISLKNPNDEIEKYINARYVSASKGIWRLFDFGLQDRSHTVVRLSVHLKGQQQVPFDPSEQSQLVKQAAEAGKHTKLTRYFELCKNNPDHELIKTLRYIDIPKHFV